MDKLKGKTDIKKELDEIVRKLNRPKKKRAADSARERIFTAFSIVEYIDKQKVSATIVNAVHKNFLINVVTAFEIFFKDLIIENRGHWEPSTFSQLLNEKKITLLEALNFRKGTRIDAEHILVSTLNFTNLDSIRAIYDKLLGINTWKAVSDYPIAVHPDFNGGKPYRLTTKFPDWVATMYKLYEIRNAIAHEDGRYKIDKEFEKDLLFMGVIMTDLLGKVVRMRTRTKNIVDVDLQIKAIENYLANKK